MQIYKTIEARLSPNEEYSR